MSTPEASASSQDELEAADFKRKPREMPGGERQDQDDEEVAAIIHQAVPASTAVAVEIASQSLTSELQDDKKATQPSLSNPPKTVVKNPSKIKTGSDKDGNGGCCNIL